VWRQKCQYLRNYIVLLFYIVIECIIMMWYNNFSSCVVCIQLKDQHNIRITVLRWRTKYYEIDFKLWSVIAINAISVAWKSEATEEQQYRNYNNDRCIVWNRRSVPNDESLRIVFFYRSKCKAIRYDYIMYHSRHR